MRFVPLAPIMDFRWPQLAAGDPPATLKEATMGIFDKAKDALSTHKDDIGKHSDKLDGGVDKAGDFVDDKTGDKYAEHVDQGQDFAKDQLGERFGGAQGADPADPNQPPA